MIFDAIFTVISAAMGLVLATMPTFSLPGFIAPGGSLDAAATDLGEFLSPLGGWLPFSDIGLAVAAVAVCATFSVTMSISRFVLSLISGGGGA